MRVTVTEIRIFTHSYGLFSTYYKPGRITESANSSTPLSSFLIFSLPIIHHSTICFTFKYFLLSFSTYTSTVFIFHIIVSP